MKKDQANKTNVERVYRRWPLVWEPGLNGSGIDPQLVWEWAWCSCTSCTSMHQSWSRAEVEEAEWRQKGLEVARGEQRRGREVIPWQLDDESHVLHSIDSWAWTCAWTLLRWILHTGCSGLLSTPISPHAFMYISHTLHLSNLSLTSLFITTFRVNTAE